MPNDLSIAPSDDSDKRRARRRAFLQHVFTQRGPAKDKDKPEAAKPATRAEAVPSEEVRAQIREAALALVDAVIEEGGEDEPSDAPNKDMPAECPACGGVGVVINEMGRRKHYRCQRCSTDFSESPAQESQEEEDLDDDDYDYDGDREGEEEDEGGISERKKGLWDNIHARRKKGLPKKKLGQKGYPKKGAFKRSQSKD